ncbi:MAG: hypothetical protein ABW321_25710 [Polyangiales bacterium]
MTLVAAPMDRDTRERGMRVHAPAVFGDPSRACNTLRAGWCACTFDAAKQSGQTLL